MNTLLSNQNSSPNCGHKLRTICHPVQLRKQTVQFKTKKERGVICSATMCVSSQKYVFHFSKLCFSNTAIWGDFSLFFSTALSAELLFVSVYNHKRDINLEANLNCLQKIICFSLYKLSSAMKISLPEAGSFSCLINSRIESQYQKHALYL